MNSTKSNSTTTFKKENQSKSTNANMQSSQLMDLFEDELKDLYWAEKAITKAIPKMIKNATSPDLVAALKSHLTETGTQVTRLEQVFESIGKKATAKKCEAMEGLIKEAEEKMESCEPGAIDRKSVV